MSVLVILNNKVMYSIYIQGMIGQDILVCMLIIGNIRTDIWVIFNQTVSVLSSRN